MASLKMMMMDTISFHFLFNFVANIVVLFLMANFFWKNVFHYDVKYFAFC
jgi:hypothetical protein